MNRSHDVQEILTEVDARVQAGDGRRALLQLLELLHAHPFDPAVLARVADVTRECGAPQEAPVFARVSEAPDDQQALYDLGYLLVGAGFPHVALAYLERCRTLEPGAPRLRYEVAYARFASGDYPGALELLDELAANEALNGEEAFAAGLLRVESLLYVGRGDAARAAFEAVDVRDSGEGGEQRLDAVAHLLARAAALPDGRRDARDWHFIEQGGVVLLTGEDRPEAWVPAVAGIEYLARLLRTLEEVVRALDGVPDAVEALGAEMLPFARVLARRLGAGVVGAFGELDDPAAERRLIVARDVGRAAAALDVLRTHDEGQDLFVLAFDPRLDHPVTPDIVGQFAADLRLPWEPDVDVVSSSAGATSIPPAAAERLLEDAVEELGDRHEGVAAPYYERLHEFLVYGNPERHPARRVFTARRVHDATSRAAPTRQ